MSFYVFGGASIDIIASSKNKIINYTSNPGKTTFSFGGVARNIADALSTYSKDVYLVSSFGNDYYSKEMYKDLKNKGIKLNYSKVVEGNGSFYIALEENNNLYVAISDNSIIEDISTKDLDVLSSKIKDEDILIIDANLKEDIIKHILINFKGYKIFEATSIPKFKRNASLITSFDLIKANKKEIYEVLNIDSLEELFKYKVDFLITDSKTAYYISNNKIIKAKNNHLINSSSNGCGDAFLAGFLACDGSVIEKLNSGMDKALERALFNSKGE